MDDLILQLGALSVALIGIAVLLRVGWRIYRKTERFFDDWFGQPAHPGHKAIPGMPARVAALEDDMTAIKEQVTPNGGDTRALGDRVVRIEKRLGTDPDDT